MSRLALTGITKRYPGCIANQKISINVDSGEIHALLGENGAGKSTLMKIIYGVVKADAGTIYWEGEQIVIEGPSHARRLGIGMVFQHFSLFDTLTVTENISLSLPKHQFSSLAKLKARIIEVSEHYGMKLDPDRYVYTLSVGEQQRVEIVRCLLQDLKLLILDEPTSVLTPSEVIRLFATLRQLAEEGCSILFITHKLDEVRQLGTQASILRQGMLSGQCDPQVTTTEQLARLMVGDYTPLFRHFEKASGGQAVLEVRQLSYQSDDPFATPLKDLSFNVKAGEIVGIAGVAGNGQEELLALISGESRSEFASVILNQKAIGQLYPSQRRKLGIGVVPEERLGRGAVPAHSLVQNTLLTNFPTLTNRWGWIDSKNLRQLSSRIKDLFNVKAESIDAQAKSLSGGNLQKFIIGREIVQHPKLLICSHPTWGVDIGAAIIIHDALIKLRDQGAGVLILSEDIEELFKICDRLGAICDGSLSPVLPAKEVSIERLGQWMAGEFADPKQVDQANEANLPEVAHD